MELTYEGWARTGPNTYRHHLGLTFTVSELMPDNLIYLVSPCQTHWGLDITELDISTGKIVNHFVPHASLYQGGAGKDLIKEGPED